MTLSLSNRESRLLRFIDVARAMPNHLPLTLLGGVLGVGIGVILFATDRPTYLAEVTLREPIEVTASEKELLERLVHSNRSYERVSRQESLSYELFRSRIALLAEPGNSFIRLQATAPSREEAVRLANKSAEILRGLVIEEHATGEDLLRRRLDRELSDVDRELTRIAVELDAMPIQNEGGSREGGQEAMLSIRKLLAQASAEKLRVESLMNASPVDGVPDTPEGRAAAQALRDLKAQKKFLSNTLGAKHPEMVRLDTQILSHEAVLQTEREKYLQLLRSQRESAEQYEKRLSGELEEQREALSVNPSSAAFETKKQEYDSLIARRKELATELGRLEKRPGLAITEFAQAALRQGDFPITPALGWLLGLTGVGYLSSVGLSLLRGAFYSSEEIERRLNLPVLSEVPRITWNESAESVHAVWEEVEGEISLRRSSRDLVTIHEPESEASEAYRSLRTALLLYANGEPPRVIQLTSAESGTGKSVTACNLAVALALAGKRTCLVDADLKHGGAAEILGAKGGVGLSDYLKGEASLDNVLRSTSHSALSTILMGQRVADTSSLLASPRMGELLRALRERFDYVVIDSPSLFRASDALIISTSVDGISLVLGKGETSAPMVKRAISQLGRVGARVLGVTLNEVGGERREAKLQLSQQQPILSLPAPTGRQLFRPERVEWKVKPDAPRKLQIFERVGVEALSELLEFQKSLLEKKLSGEMTHDVVVFSEPAPGRSIGRGTPNDGASIEMDRGGGMIEHGPGQLAAFILMDIGEGGLPNFLKNLRKIGQNTVQLLGYDPALAQRVMQAGIGVRQNVTFHGFFINVTGPGEGLASGASGVAPDFREVKESFILSLMSEYEFSGITVLGSRDGWGEEESPQTIVGNVG